MKKILPLFIIIIIFFLILITPSFVSANVCCANIGECSLGNQICSAATLCTEANGKEQCGSSCTVGHAEQCDTFPPTYSLNSTNSTTNGTAIQFNLKWSDDHALDKAITSLWNGSAWVNASSWCSLSGTSSWCNQTMIVNSTPQQLWWKQYANDTHPNWATSENFSLVTAAAAAAPTIFSPYWLYNWTSIPSTYNPNTKSYFNITWNGTKMANSSIWFNSTICANNCTMANLTAWGSATNFTFNATLPAGSFGFRIYGNNTTSYENVTPQWNFSIANASNTLSLYFNNVSGQYLNQNMTVTYPTSTNFTGFCLAGTCGIYSNDSTTTQNNTNVVRAVSTYKITLNSTGNQNYTSNTTNYYIFVNQNTTNLVDIYFINSTGAYKNQNITTGYAQTTTNATLVYTQSGTANLYEDNVSVSNPINRNLTIGTHNYQGNVTGNANYSTNSTGATYYITVQDQSSPTYSLNSTNSTFAGMPISHNLYWQDNVNLSGYIFSFCNGTWSGTNCLSLALTTVQLLSNVTDNTAYTGTNGDSGSPSSATTNYTDLNYNSTNVTDANYESIFAASTESANNYNNERYTFNISSFGISNIQWLQYCHRGYYSNGQGWDYGAMKLKYYNTSNSSWLTDQSETTSIATYCKNFTTNSAVQSVYNSSSGLLQFGETCEADTCWDCYPRVGTSTNCYVDFVNLTVSYTFTSTQGWVNDTWNSTNFNGLTSAWSNVTKVVNSTVGAKIAWCVYANDTSNNWNRSSCDNPFSYTTTDGIPPTYSLNSTNSTLTGVTVKHSLYWQDNINLSYAIFSFDNCTGSLQNITNMSVSGTGNWTNFTVTVNSTPNCFIRWCVYANDTSNNWNRTSCDNPFSYNTTGGNLTVALINPVAGSTTNLDQNSTFVVNATVQCIGAICGNVYGTVRYNGSSANPDTAINSTQGAAPFYNTSGTILQSCGVMNQGDTCQLNWTINATGNFTSGYNVYKIGVLFNTTYNQNHTDNATINIIECTESMNLGWDSIDFGNVNPNTGPRKAPGNVNDLYNITNTGTCTLKVWIKGTDLQNTTFPYPNTIGVGNLTWSNTTNSSANSYAMSSSYVLVNSSLTLAIKNVTTYYWLTVLGPIYAGSYNGTMYICENTTQQSGVANTC